MTRSDDHGQPRSRPVAILTHSYYLEDPRVRRQAEALVNAGRPVDVFALRNQGEAPADEVSGVRIIRLPVQRHQGARLTTYALEYLDFLARAGFQLLRRHPRRRYGLVQVATLPDFLVFAATPLRLAAGVPILIDLHEAMPEFFRSRFPRVASRPVRWLMEALERASIAAASHALTVNDALRDRLLARGVRADSLDVVLNSPDLSRFDPSAHAVRPFMADGTLRLVYAGAVTPTYELRVAVEAVARLTHGDPGGEPPAPFPVCLAIYGRGDSMAELRAQAEARRIGDRVVLHGRIPLEGVAAAIAAADAGLAPTRRDAFTDFSLSTKLFEYAVMGKVPVASRLPTVVRYFGDDALVYYEPGDAGSLAAAIRRIVQEPGLRERVLAKAAARVEQLSWPREAARYIALVDHLART